MRVEFEKYGFTLTKDWTFIFKEKSHVGNREACVIVTCSDEVNGGPSSWRHWQQLPWQQQNATHRNVPIQQKSMWKNSQSGWGSLDKKLKGNLFWFQHSSVLGCWRSLGEAGEYGFLSATVSLLISQMYQSEIYSCMNILGLSLGCDQQAIILQLGGIKAFAEEEDMQSKVHRSNQMGGGVWVDGAIAVLLIPNVSLLRSILILEDQYLISVIWGIFYYQQGHSRKQLHVDIMIYKVIHTSPSAGHVWTTALQMRKRLNSVDIDGGWPQAQPRMDLSQGLRAATTLRCAWEVCDVQWQHHTHCVEHLRFNHSTEYKEEGRLHSLSFLSSGKNYPRTESYNLKCLSTISLFLNPKFWKNSLPIIGMNKKFHPGLYLDLETRSSGVLHITKSKSCVSSLQWSGHMLHRLHDLFSKSDFTAPINIPTLFLKQV